MNHSTWLAGVVMALGASVALAVDPPDDTVPPPGAEPIYTSAQIQHPELYQNLALRSWIQKGWDYLGQTGGSDVIEWLFNGRKQRTGNSWLIWVVEIKLSGAFAPDHAGQPSYRAERQLWWVNCTDHTNAIRAQTRFADQEGTNPLVDQGFSLPTSVPASYEEAPPGSVSEVISIAACPLQSH